MKITGKNIPLALALAAGLIGSAGWSGASHACSDSPVVSGVCAMAAVNLGNFNNTYFVANGTVLAISQYQALYSLLGATYGGNGTTNFALPDLRGRVLLGADPRVPAYGVGKTGGASTVTLTTEQLPAHVHALVNTNIDFSKVTATTTLGTMAAALSGSLALKASSNVTTNNPSGSSLGTTGGTTRIYSSDAPTVTMNAASIDSSTLTVGLSGAPSTTLSGTAALSGSTAPTGSGLPVSVMQPYLAMTYYIAWNGTYPSRD